MNFSIEINQAIEWTIRFVSVCILIDTWEKFYNLREFNDRGIFGWKWNRQFLGFSQRRKIIRQFADAFFNFRIWVFLITLRGFAAFVLLFFTGQGLIDAIALFILFVVGSLENFRRMPFRPETPNRFTLLIVGALFLRTLVPTETLTIACLWFIALQSCLSYATAGIAKLFNKRWLKGEGVIEVVNSPFFFASPKLAHLFDRNPIFGKVLNYLAIAIESTFPVVLLVGKPYYLFFVIWGLLFHISNAFILRLNNYFWAWLATYPAIIYIAQR